MRLDRNAKIIWQDLVGDHGFAAMREREALRKMVNGVIEGAIEASDGSKAVSVASQPC